MENVSSSPHSRAKDPTDVNELVEYITRYWTRLTGLKASEMHKEGEFPTEVRTLVDAHGFDYQEFVDAWTTFHG